MVMMCQQSPSLNFQNAKLEALTILLEGGIDKMCRSDIMTRLAVRQCLCTCVQRCVRHRASGTTVNTIALFDTVLHCE